QGCNAPPHQLGGLDRRRFLFGGTEPGAPVPGQEHQILDMDGQLVEVELNGGRVVSLGGEVQQPETAEVAGYDVVRPLVVGQGFHVVQCLRFGGDEVFAGGLHLDQRGAGDQGVDVAALPGR